MARYTGPRTKKSRAFGESIFGFDKAFEKRKYGPGQHGNSRRRRQKSDYAVQLMEKQKAKYTYGVLERQFRNLFKKASSKADICRSRLKIVIARSAAAHSCQINPLSSPPASKSPSACLFWWNKNWPPAGCGFEGRSFWWRGCPR